MLLIFTVRMPTLTKSLSAKGWSAKSASEWRRLCRQGTSRKATAQERQPTTQGLSFIFNEVQVLLRFAYGYTDQCLSCMCVRVCAHTTSSAFAQVPNTQFSTFESRLKTFRRWPHSAAIRPLAVRVLMCVRGWLMGVSCIYTCIYLCMHYTSTCTCM